VPSDDVERAPMMRRRIIADSLVPTLTLVGVLVAWEAATHAFHVPRFVMPAPSAILAEGWEWRYRFIGHTWVTLYETLGGFALAIGVGVPLAVLIVYSPVLRRALYPLIVLAQSVPKIAIAPVLLLVLGHGEIPKVVVAFLVAFFPVVVDTATGLAATPPELLELSRSYRASAFKTFVKVRLPMAMPFFFAGAKVAITLAVIGAVVGEFVGSDQGLGYVILSATSYWKTELAFSSMILLSVMAIVLFGAVSLVERLACPWLAPIAADDASVGEQSTSAREAPTSIA
jgi:NitT/TauT family transport system permease protein